MSTPDLDAIQNRSDDAMMHESLEPGSYAEIAWHSARDVPALLAYARDLEARIGRVEKLLSDKYLLWAAICGNTCSKDIVGVDHDAIADEIAASIRAALTATDAS